MGSTTCLQLLIISVALLSAPPTSAKLTAYDLLNLFFFPAGLLPKGVAGYDILDLNTGQFAVYFKESCSFSVRGYELKFDKRITGNISPLNITNLTGVQVRVLLLFWNIVGVTDNLFTNQLEFSIGFTSATFPVSNFAESPQCGCGFDCNHKWNTPATPSLQHYTM